MPLEKGYNPPRLIIRLLEPVHVGDSFDGMSFAHSFHYLLGREVR